jgi:pimeloyl-ACP methyl ester carboxylesterase
MAPVARELCADWGIVEPLQTADSVDGQIRELREVLEMYADAPVAVVGSSWGAMLGFIFAAGHPALVKKLILIGSGVFESHYAAEITQTRLDRFSEEQRETFFALAGILDAPAVEDKDEVLSQLGRLIEKVDTYDPLTLESEVLGCQYDVHQRVWRDAEVLRASGELLALGKQIDCPVVAIHGDYDPHPADGIRKPLSSVLQDFRFILLEHCGHYPWNERQARDRFYEILRHELRA